MKTISIFLIGILLLLAVSAGPALAKKHSDSDSNSDSGSSDSGSDNKDTGSDGTASNTDDNKASSDGLDVEDNPTPPDTTTTPPDTTTTPPDTTTTPPDTTTTPPDTGAVDTGTDNPTPGIISAPPTDQTPICVTNPEQCDSNGRLIIPDTGTKLCPTGQHNDGKDNCIPDIRKCLPKPGTNDCNTGNGGTTIINNRAVAISKTTINQKTVVNTKINNVFKTFAASSGTSTAQPATKQPPFLLLLSTSQLCQLAGDVQCAAKQRDFNTINLVTKLSGSTWSVSGQVENRGVAQSNLVVTAHFYDNKANNVGGLATAKVTPTSLATHKIGVFNIAAKTSTMNGIPSFVRLEYQ
jgi:hypothetical protein